MCSHCHCFHSVLKKQSASEIITPLLQMNGTLVSQYISIHSTFDIRWQYMKLQFMFLLFCYLLLKSTISYLFSKTFIKENFDHRLIDAHGGGVRSYTDS